MRPPRYYGPLEREEYVLFWASYARDHFGLHAGLDFERFHRDLHEADAAHAREVRDLSREIDDLNGGS